MKHLYYYTFIPIIIFLNIGFSYTFSFFPNHFFFNQLFYTYNLLYHNFSSSRPHKKKEAIKKRKKHVN